MRITVKFFAVLKDRAGIPETSLDLENDARVSDVSRVLSEKFPALKNDLPRIAFAINREYAKPDSELQDGDELALIPPVSGGSI